MTLQLLYRNATLFLFYLREVDKASSRVENELHLSMKNKELIQMLGLEKSLVYFSTSLKGNEIVLEKLLRMDFVKDYPDDTELLEDVIIENKQAIEMSNIYRDILSGTMDAFASVISNNLNIVMKVLAAVTIILTIPSIIFGLWGSNVPVPFESSPLRLFCAIIGIAALCTAVAAWLFLGEKLTKKTIIAMLLAVAGVAGASLAAESSDQASNPILGNLLMVGAVLSATGYAVCVRFISRRYSFLSISAIQALGGTIVFLPFVFTTPMPVNVTMPAIGGLLYMGLGVGFLVYLSFNFALKHLEAASSPSSATSSPYSPLSSPLPSSGNASRWLKPSVSGSRSWASSLLPCQKNNGNNRTGERASTPTLSPLLQLPQPLLLQSQ